MGTRTGKQRMLGDIRAQRKHRLMARNPDVRATIRAESERPENRKNENADHDHEDFKRQAELPIISETEAAGA